MKWCSRRREELDGRGWGIVTPCHCRSTATATATSTPFVHEGPRRATKDHEGPRRRSRATAGKTRAGRATATAFCPRRAAKGHEEGQGQGQERQGQKVKGRKGATAGKAMSGRATAEFFCPARAKGLPLQLRSTADKKSRSWCCSYAVAVLSGPSRPLMNKDFDVAVLRSRLA